MSSEGTHTGGTPRHVAIIMDGNGRWATARGWPRQAGHREGAKAVRRVVEAAAATKIETLTLYAFSSDNWSRPAREVTALMRLFRAYLAGETQRLVENGIRLSVIGRRDRLADPLVRAIRGAEAATAAGTGMNLRVAIDYSAREMILRAAMAAGAAAEAGAAPCTAEQFAELLGRVSSAGAPAPDVDLLIRTGGEQRVSDFLLWECAYAELYFTNCMWPDFGAPELAAAIADFCRRQRRFGRVPQAATG